MNYDLLHVNFAPEAMNVLDLLNKLPQFASRDGTHLTEQQPVKNVLMGISAGRRVLREMKC